MDKSISSKRDIISLFFSIIALHMYVISWTTMSLVLMAVAIIDSAIAFFLGLRTESDYGHGGLIIGIVVFIASVVTLFIVGSAI